MRAARVLIALVTLFAASVLAVTGFARPAYALSPSDYFTYTYSFSLDKTTISGSETFFVTVSGQATCIQSLPLGMGATTVSARVIARHQQTGAAVVLNADFSMSYSNFPDKKGQTVSDSVRVPLFFPDGSAPGIYSVVGQIVQAKVSMPILGPVDVTGSLPAEQVVGLVSYALRVSGGTQGTPAPETGTGGQPVNGASPTAHRALIAFVDAGGRIIQDVQHESLDRNVSVTIPRNTIARTDSGAPLLDLTVDVRVTPARLPDDREALSAVYSFGPSGATFDPPIAVSFLYDGQSLPAGADEKRAYAAVWSVAAGAWEPLPSVVDVASGAVRAEVRHFSIMTVLVPTAPAAFVFSDLRISPARPQAGDSIYASVHVRNTGDLAGEQKVGLKLDGAEAAQQSVALAGRDTRQVTFALPAGKAGGHTIVVGDVAASYNVQDTHPSAMPTPPSPTYSISGLTVKPAFATMGQTVTVSVYIANDGDGPGAYAASLVVDGRVVTERSIDLQAGTQQKVVFDLYANEAGTHTVEMNGLTATFGVSIPPATEPPQTASQTRFPAAPLAVAGAGVTVAGVAVLAWRRRQAVRRA